MDALIALTDRGLYCPQADIYIDPWRPPPTGRVIVTHAHSDHARWGAERYLTVLPGERVLRTRLGSNTQIDAIPYGKQLQHRGVTISLHPAGHVLGSAQVRLEYQGHVCVITGDYKRQPDPTCEAFEPLKCHSLLTESTFGLPVYRWEPVESVFQEINDWWRQNREQGKTSIIYGYSLGKSQRVLSGLDPGIGPIFLHGAIEKMTQTYREAGVELPQSKPVSAMPSKHSWKGSMIIAPPSAHHDGWLKKFGDVSTANASGWMRIRGTRRRGVFDRGFVLSDHVDWPGLLQTIKETEAETVWVTHGFVEPVVRYLKEKGLNAAGLKTLFEGDSAEETASEEELGQ